jgi:hypothetical protein
MKRNSGQKSTLTERDHLTLRRIVSKNHTTAAQVTAELNIHLENPVSTKTVQCELHKSNIHSRAATAKTLIIKSNAQMCKQWCHDHKTLTSDNQTTGNACMIWSGDLSFTLFPTSGRVYIWRRAKEAYNPDAWLAFNSETWGRFCDGLGGNIMLLYSVGPIITLHGQITARE